MGSMWRLHGGGEWGLCLPQGGPAAAAGREKQSWCSRGWGGGVGTGRPARSERSLWVMKARGHTARGGVCPEEMRWCTRGSSLPCVCSLCLETQKWNKWFRLPPSFHRLEN